MKGLKVEKWGSRSLGLMISSGGDERGLPRLILEGFGYYVTIRIPAIVKPERKKVKATYWSETDIARMGRDWYWEITERRFGFYINDGFLNVNFGRSTMDSSTEQRWGYFLPWQSWRHVRHSLYDLSGKHLLDLPQFQRGESSEQWNARWEAETTAKAAQPKAYFQFLDYDAEAIKAECNIEEREWRRGTGWWKWLSLFYARKIDRSLMLSFSSEVGRKKGSWKGGTVGHAVSMEPGETPEAAFRRYCKQQELVFIGPCEPWARKQPEAA